MLHGAQHALLIEANVLIELVGIRKGPHQVLRASLKACLIYLWYIQFHVRLKRCNLLCHDLPWLKFNMINFKSITFAYKSDY